ncbi:hypothetical protein BVI434_1810023 [Burkholderia vietnamiensis]|nr:hypothetical protein BVI434_1810023 [Burkholderia vietnamiensis]
MQIDASTGRVDRRSIREMWHGEFLGRILICIHALQIQIDELIG